MVEAVLDGFKTPEGRSPVVVCMPSTPLYIRADQHKAQQVVLNVLANAYKYSPAGGEVRIELVQSPAGEDAVPCVGICITDQGIGMSAAQVARVFERFYRADASGKILGTGLGMSIVHEIMGLHGGKVDVVSTPGAGTTVSLWWLKENIP